MGFGGRVRCSSKKIRETLYLRLPLHSQTPRLERESDTRKSQRLRSLQGEGNSRRRQPGAQAQRLTEIGQDVMALERPSEAQELG
jgi:hypothetical protein